MTVCSAVCTFGAYVVNYVSYPRKTRRNKLVYQKSALHEKVIQVRLVIISKIVKMEIGRDVGGVPSVVVVVS